MKKLLFLLLIGGSCYGQTTYYIRSDSTRLQKVGANNELILENGTRAVKGLLTNYGNGRTRFIGSRISNDTLFVGMDTLIIPGGSGSPNSNVGSAYRLAIPNTNNIKTLAAKYGIILDSATSNEIGVKVDTATLFPVVRGFNTNIYNSNGTLPGNRIVDMAVNNLKFTNSGGFSVYRDFSGSGTVTTNVSTLAFGAVEGTGELFSDGNGTMALGYAQDNVAKISANGSGSIASGFTNDGDVIYSSGEGAFAYGTANSGGNIDSITAVGNGAFTFGSTALGNLYNSGNISFAFGSGFTNIDDNVFSVGWGSKQFLIDGTTGNVKVPTPGTASTSVATVDATQTLTNKRWTARVGSTTSSATPTINTDNVDVYKLTAQAADITSMTTNLSGTPNDGDILEIQITATGAHTLAWGSSFVSTTVTLPTTISTTTLSVILQYYTTSSYGNNKWGCVNYY